MKKNIMTIKAAKETRKIYDYMIGARLYGSSEKRAAYETAFRDSLKAVDYEITRVQFRCRARLTSAQYAVESLYRVIKPYADIMPAKYLENATISYNCDYFVVPSSYKGIPESTWIYATYKSGAWVITEIKRGHAAYRGYLHLPDTAAEYLKKAIPV